VYTPRNTWWPLCRRPEVRAPSWPAVQKPSDGDVQGSTRRLGRITRRWAGIRSVRSASTHFRRFRTLPIGQFLPDSRQPATASVITSCWTVNASTASCVVPAFRFLRVHHSLPVSWLGIRHRRLPQKWAVERATDSIPVPQRRTRPAHRADPVLGIRKTPLSALTGGPPSACASISRHSRRSPTGELLREPADAWNVVPFSLTAGALPISPRCWRTAIPLRYTWTAPRKPDISR